MNRLGNRIEIGNGHSEIFPGVFGLALAAAALGALMLFRLRKADDAAQSARRRRAPQQR